MSRDTTEDETTRLRLTSEGLPLLFSTPLGWGQECTGSTSQAMFAVFVSQAGTLLMSTDNI